MDEKFTVHVHKYVKSNLKKEDSRNIKFFIPKEIVKFIKTTKKKRAAGPDEIPNSTFHALPNIAVVYITNIINAILNLRHFLAKWKHATIVTISKPGKNPGFAENYRQIELLNTLAKIAEKAIHLSLSRFIREARVLPNTQFGFRAAHSTKDQLLRVIEFISEGFNKKK